MIVEQVSGSAWAECPNGVESAQKYLEEEKVALTYLFEPIFAAFAGAMLLGETLDGRTLAGAALIFSALLIAEIDVPKFLSLLALMEN